MPGIVGLVTRMPRDRAQAELHQMMATMRHESFYGTGTWTDESLGVYVGWSVHQNSFSDGMPLRNERQDLTLIFSGEEYPEPGVAQRLKGRGHTFDQESPDYLVHLAEEDPLFPAGLNGRFHGLLIDSAQRRVALFNDRYGMHHIYFHESEDGFYFAAEAKAILAVRPELREIDMQGLGEFLSCGCVLDNRTLFKGLRLLPGASRWTFSNGAVERKAAYFQPQEWENQSLLEPEEYYQEIRSTFSRNLPRYFESKKQGIGVSLTGGLDTRMIMAWHKSPRGSLPCYSFGGMFRECQDVIVARKVATLCDQPYQTIEAGQGFLSRFAHYAERAVYLTDGNVDVSLCPDLHMYEQSRQIAPVRMTGNYGGEVLRRVRAFKPMEPLSGLFDGELVTSINQTRETYAGVLRAHQLSFAVFRQAPWFYHGSLSLEQSQLASRTPYLDNDFVRTVFRAPASASMSNEVCLRLIGDGDATLRQLRTDRGAGVSGLWAAARRAVLEFSFKAEYGYDYGMPQWVAQADHFLSPLRLERLFLGRHKFYHFRLWYREALSGYVRDTLLSPQALSRPYLARENVKAIVEGHIKGHRNYTTEIHKLLTLELLHQLFVDAPLQAASV